MKQKRLGRKDRTHYVQRHYITHIEKYIVPDLMIELKAAGMSEDDVKLVYFLSVYGEIRCPSFTHYARVGPIHHAASWLIEHDVSEGAYVAEERGEPTTIIATESIGRLGDALCAARRRPGVHELSFLGHAMGINGRVYLIMSI